MHAIQTRQFLSFCRLDSGQRDVIGADNFRRQPKLSALSLKGCQKKQEIVGNTFKMFGLGS
ncbi:MAG: hypothetical protein DRH04_08015 [Deltaproteobacteria bacterium]|nr:MAG: hypothetical protein DRH04_08015 [Deltaproteobacteria bacterium]